MASPAAAPGGEIFASAVDDVSKFKKEVFSKLAFLGIPHGDASSLKHLWKFVNLTVKLACEAEARQSSQPRKLVRALSKELGVPRAELFVKWLTEKIQSYFSIPVDLPMPADAGSEEPAAHSADVCTAPAAEAVVVIDAPKDDTLDEALVQLKGSDGRTYFWNRRQNSCAWELPAGVQAKWIGQKVADGRTYYWSRGGSQACWVLPKLKHAEVRSAEARGDCASAPPRQEAEQPPQHSACVSSADAQLSKESSLIPSTPLAGCLVSAPVSGSSSQALQQAQSTAAKSACASPGEKEFQETPVPRHEQPAPVPMTGGTVVEESVMETPVLVAPMPTSAITGARPMLLPEVGLLQPLVLATVPGSAACSQSAGQDLGPFEGALQEAAKEADLAAKRTVAGQDDGKEEKIEQLSSKLEEMTADSSSLRAEVALLKRELASLLGMHSAAGQAQQQEDGGTREGGLPRASEAETAETRDLPRRDSEDEQAQPTSDEEEIHRAKCAGDDSAKCASASEDEMEDARAQPADSSEDEAEDECTQRTGSSEEEAEDDHSRHATDSDQELGEDRVRPASCSEVEAEDEVEADNDRVEREGDSEDDVDSLHDGPASDSDDETRRPVTDSEEDCVSEAEATEEGTHSAAGSDKEAVSEAEDEEPVLKRRRVERPRDAGDSSRPTRRREDSEAWDFWAQADSPAPTTKARQARSPSPARSSCSKHNAEVSKLASNTVAPVATPERPLASPLRRRPAMPEASGSGNPRGHCVFDFAEPCPADQRPAASTARSSGWAFWASPSRAAASEHEDAKSATEAVPKLREVRLERSRSPDGVGNGRLTEGESMLDKFMTPLQGDGMLDKFMTVVKYGKPPGDFHSDGSPLSRPPGQWDSPRSDVVSQRSERKHNKVEGSHARHVLAAGKRGRRASRGGA
mmetsp:Transcript_108473/g.188312  ORF Transcript_108473/g.188312 Transcript_108473/m.188312 type:complete len:919 (-) Transcript_108473:139-2895(-)